MSTAMIHLWQTDHPLLAGVTEGLLSVGVVALLAAAAIGVPAHWPVLLLALFAFGRPALRQAGVLVLLAVPCYVLSDATPAQALIPLAVAAMAMGIVRVQGEQRRWTMTHAVAGFAAVLAYAFSLLALQGATGWLPALLWTGSIYIFACVGCAILEVVREYRSFSGTEDYNL